MWVFHEAGILLQKFFHIRRCLLQPPGILYDISNAEIEISALPDTKEIPGPPKFQILLRDVESVVGLVENFQPFRDFLPLELSMRIQ